MQEPGAGDRQGAAAARWEDPAGGTVGASVGKGWRVPVPVLALAQGSCQASLLPQGRASRRLHKCPMNQGTRGGGGVRTWARESSAGPVLERSRSARGVGAGACSHAFCLTLGVSVSLLKTLGLSLGWLFPLHALSPMPQQAV